MNEFGPFVANTHTETTVSGTAMTKAYHHSRSIIKKHVNANSDDVHYGWNRDDWCSKQIQRILGLKVLRT
jgi:selenocysteine lyase/cysteine desulfurase